MPLSLSTIAIAGLSGELSIETHKGAATVTAQSGPVHVETHKGTVDIDFAKASGLKIKENGLIEVDRYGDRSTAFDAIISATEDHFWDPNDPAYTDAVVAAALPVLVADGIDYGVVGGLKAAGFAEDEVLAGVTIVNDVSARDVQLPQMQFYKGKSYRSFGPAGPVLLLLEDLHWADHGSLDALRHLPGDAGHVHDVAAPGLEVRHRGAAAVKGSLDVHLEDLVPDGLGQAVEVGADEDHASPRRGRPDGQPDHRV